MSGGRGFPAFCGKWMRAGSRGGFDAKAWSVPDWPSTTPGVGVRPKDFENTSPIKPFVLGFSGCQRLFVVKNFKIFLVCIDFCVGK
jgi:hypothetical protein